MRRWLGTVAVLVLVAVTLAAVFHNAALRFALASIGVAGYHIETGDLRFGSDHGALLDVHITRNGEPVLDARRIDVYYHLRDLLPGSTHRFGLLGITVDRPAVTIIHHQDGTYNVAIPSAGRSGPARPSAPYRPVPLDLTIRVRDASATLIDRYRYYEHSRVQRVDHIDAVAQIDTASRTHYVVTGRLEDAGPQPFRATGSVNYRTGFALHRVSIKAIPISTIGNYFIDSPAAHILGGAVRGMVVRIYAFDANTSAVHYHIIGGGYLQGGRMDVRTLDAPLLGIDGPIDIFDGGFAARNLHATVGGIPIVFAGGIFNFRDPQFRLGVQGHADLRNLKNVARFAAKLPIRGAVAFHTLIEGPISRPLMLVGFSGKRFDYQQIPIDDPRGSVALLGGNLVVLPFHGSYDGIALHVEGNLELGAHIGSTLWLHAAGNSRRIPYLGALVPNQPVAVEALLSGTDLRVGARGFLTSLQDPRNLSGFYAIDPNGRGAFGPIALRDGKGGTLFAGFDLDRPHGNSLFWISARNMHLRQPVPIVMPGVAIPQLPPMTAMVRDANIAATGSAANAVIGGSAYLTHATIAGIPFDAIAARFAGPFADAEISSVHAQGPWGRFDGSGSFAPSVIAARGNYSGRLEALRPFIGNFPAAGFASGPVAIALGHGAVYVQAQNAQLQGANIHGIPISAITGTMKYDRGVLRIYSAQAHAAGGAIVAAGNFDTGAAAQPTRLALATTELQASALRGIGLPLDAGSVEAEGALMPGTAIPGLDAGVVLKHGAALGYGPFFASADVRISGGAVSFAHGIAGLGSTYGEIAGSIASLGSVPRYDVRAQVPAGSIPALARLVPGGARVPMSGSFGGSLDLVGTSANPQMHARIAVPVGMINGLGFSNAQGRVDASRGGVAIDHASVLVGSTSATFSAVLANGETAFDLRAAHATLSDFNDAFDTGDTLAGKGYVGISFTQFHRLLYTSGDIGVSGLRYRSLPIGDTFAKWTSLRDVVHERLNVGGAHGRLESSGTIAFAPTNSVRRLVSHSRYNIQMRLHALDLGTWLPAFGFPQVPLTGHVDASALVLGTFPHIGVNGTASMNDGTIGPLPIRHVRIAMHSEGDRIDVTSAQLAVPALSASAAGSFGFSPAAPLDVTVQAVTDDLPRLVAQLSKKHIALQGHIESTLSIRGTMRSPTFSAGVDARNLNYAGIPIPSLIGQVRLHRRSLVVSNAEIAFAKGGRATLAGSMPLRLRPFGIGPLKAPISMDLFAQGVDLASFSSILRNSTKLSGTLDGHIGVFGTVADPRIVGRLSMQQGGYVSALETMPITRTVAQMTFNGTTATLDHLHSQIGSGTLDGSGTLNFGGGLHGGPLNYAVSIVTRGAQIAMPAYGSGTITSALQLQRSGDRLAQLRGDVNVEQALIPFSAFLAFSGSGGGSANAPAPPPFNLGFDLGITAEHNVSVRGGAYGFGLNIAAAGKAHLTGSLRKPALDGSFSATSGTLTFVDRAFRVQRATVSFDPADGVLPYIDAVGTTQVVNTDPDVTRNPTGSAQITVAVRGRVSPSNAAGSMGLRMTLSSNPPGYTDQQLIAMLLPLGGLVGPIQYTETGAVLPPGQLRGAPAAGSGGLLPPNVLVRENGSLTVGQEAFNILNAQFASGLLSPVENALGSAFGLSDVNLTLDYSGAFGVNFRRILAKNFYAIYGTTFGVPVRQTFGFAYQPNAFTSAQLSLWFQQGPVPLFLTANQTISSNPRAASGQALAGTNGFTFLFQRLF